MIKFYKLLVLIPASFFILANTYAQQKKQKHIGSKAVIPKVNLFRSGSSYRTTATGCDTINIPPPTAWSLALYSDDPNGFVSGNNAYSDKEKAAYFDVSSTPDTYLTKAWIFFGVANSNTPANLTKTIPIKVYDGTGGTPGTLLATVNKQLGDFTADVDNFDVSEIVFPTAVSLPASKKFFISVDVSNLAWGITMDSLAIFSNDIGETIVGENGYAWEKWSDNTWHTFGGGWGVDFSLFIFPFVSTNQTCTILPIRLAQFAGTRYGSENVLRWTTASEQNNKGFELQRSADGKNFSAVTFISSKVTGGNSNENLSYNFTDKNPLSGNNYYRLKQIDNDEKNTYSAVVLLKALKGLSLQVSGIYPNPASSLMKVELFAPANDRINLVVTDQTGRKVLQQSALVVPGDNTLSIGIEKLPAGIYFIKAVNNKGFETEVTKFIRASE